jgi:hypothetical protein
MEWCEAEGRPGVSPKAPATNHSQHRNGSYGFGRRARRDTGGSVLTGLPDNPVPTKCHGRADT